LIFKLTAFTFPIDSTTFVAKLFTASAPHMVTAHGAFYPVFAVWALLHLLPLDELNELLIIFVHYVAYLILLTRLVLVEWYPTVQAEILFALGTIKFVVFLIKYKGILTVS
jgi:hypothetical protein